MTPRNSRPTGENARALRVLALVAVVVGLVALTTAACVLSYSSVHDFALRAGISPSFARIYPDISDAMLVMAGCAVLALRGAGLPSRVYGWLSFILLLGALAASSVVHEAGISVPLRAAEITAAVFPWALVLLAFGLLLTLLRYARRRRQIHRESAAAGALAATQAALEPGQPGGSGEAGGYQGAEEYDAGGYVDVGQYEGAGQYERAGQYEGGEGYEYGASQATSQYHEISPEPMSSGDSGEPGGHDAAPASSEPATHAMSIVSPVVPAPRASVEPDEAPAQPPRAAVRPAEMQLRARTSRQTEPSQAATADPAGGDVAGSGSVEADSAAADSAEADQPAAEPIPPTRAPVAEPPTSGFTGDTIPRGELNPAPTTDQASGQPPKLDRPRSSPTPPS